MKNRSLNYSPQEKELLLNLILEYKEVIENKKTNGASSEEKNKAWEDVTKKFNAQSISLTHRSEESLRKLYKNQKKYYVKK